MSDGAHWLQIQIVAGVEGLIITLILFIANMFVFHSELLSGSNEESIVMDMQSLGLMTLSGFFVFFGMVLNIAGYQIGDATKVASMEYLDLIYAFLFQWFVFEDMPDIYEWIGLSLLLSTCALHFMEEWLHYREVSKTDAIQ